MVPKEHSATAFTARRFQRSVFAPLVQSNFGFRPSGTLSGYGARLGTILHIRSPRHGVASIHHTDSEKGSDNHPLLYTIVGLTPELITRSL